MSLNKIYYAIVLALSCLLMSACSSTPDSVFLEKAERISNKMLELIANKQFDKTIDLYDARFFERMPPAQWVRILQKFSEKVGDAKSWKITATSVEPGFSTISAVTTVIVYRVNHERTYSIQKFTFLSDEQADKMDLVGHYIDFPELNN